MVVQMIGVGEQAGALEAMLTKIADFYEEEVDAAVGDLMTAMEPAMIVVLGTSSAASSFRCTCRSLRSWSQLSGEVTNRNFAGTVDRRKMAASPDLCSRGCVFRFSSSFHWLSRQVCTIPTDRRSLLLGAVFALSVLLVCPVSQ